MSSVDDTGTHFATMSAELLNGLAFLLSREPGGDDSQAAAQVGLMKRALRDQVKLMASMKPDRIEGPENFDIRALATEATGLLELLDAWEQPAGNVPEEIRACALRVMRAMGFAESQIATFAS